jgi:hypothetical protein
MGEPIPQTGGCALQEIQNCQPRLSEPSSNTTTAPICVPPDENIMMGLI